MQARFTGFGTIEIDNRHFDHDVIINKDRISKRKKKPSRAYRERYGHTPLSTDEKIPWGGKHLIIGTGAYGKMPIMPELLTEAKERGIDVIAVPTDTACKLISGKHAGKVRAVLHVTC